MVLLAKIKEKKIVQAISISKKLILLLIIYKNY
jgi:hypothetical protein